MKINGDFEVKVALIHSVAIESDKYWRISYLRKSSFANNQVESTTLLEDFEVEPILKNWKAGALLGAFAIGHRLAEDAEIIRLDNETRLSQEEIKSIFINKLH